MGRLLKAEFLKLSKSLAFKVMLLVSLGLGVLIGFALMQFAGYNGSEALQAAVQERDSAIVLAVIFAGIYIGAEYLDRTYGMGIISGCSRTKLMVAKMVVFLLGLAAILSLYPVIAAVVASVRNGFGEFNAQVFNYLLRTAGLYLLGIAVLGIFCVFLVTMVKNIGGAIGAGMGILMFGSVLSQFEKLTPVLKYTIFYQLGQAAAPASLPLYIGVNVIWLAGSLAAALAIFKRSELK